MSISPREANGQEVQESRIDQTVGDFYQGLFALPLNLTLAYEDEGSESGRVVGRETEHVLCATKVSAVYISTRATT